MKFYLFFPGKSPQSPEGGEQDQYRKRQMKEAFVVKEHIAKSSNHNLL